MEVGGGEWGLNQVLGLQPAGDCSYRRHCGPLSTPEEVLGAGDGAAGEQYEIIHADLKGREEGDDVRKQETERRGG